MFHQELLEDCHHEVEEEACQALDCQSLGLAEDDEEVCVGLAEDDEETCPPLPSNRLW